MAGYIVRRLALVIVVLAVVSLGTFLVYFVLPAHHDAMFWLWTHGRVTGRMDRVRTGVQGLDRPVWAQYLAFMRHLVLGDRSGWPGLGYSLATRQPLGPVLMSRLLVSLQVVGGALLLWLTVATPVGLLSAARPRTWSDRISLGLVLFGVSCPVFLLGELALYVLSYHLGVLPGPGFDPLGSSGIGPWLGHLILPWIVLSPWFAALYARMWRASMAETLSQDYIRTARATGASETRVLLRHGVRASVSPIITMLGMDLGTLIGGSIIVEKIFNIPGLGNFLLQSVAGNDLSALVAISVLAAVAVTIANLIVDIVHACLDPRIRNRA